MQLGQCGLGLETSRLVISKAGFGRLEDQPKPAKKYIISARYSAKYVTKIIRKWVGGCCKCLASQLATRKVSEWKE